MAYINKKEYQKIINYAPSGTTSLDIQKALIARGHIIQGVNDQEQKSFGGQLLKDIVNPVAKSYNLLKTGLPVVGSALRAAPATLLGIGDKEKASQRLKSSMEKAGGKQREQFDTVFGSYNPITSYKEVAGTFLEGASMAYGGGALPGVAKAGIRGLLKSAAIRGMKAGAVGGAGFGVGRGMQDDLSTRETITQGVVGGALGAIGGGVLGAASFGGSLAGKSIVNKVSRKLQPIAEQTKQKLTDYIGKAIKPSTAGRTANQIQNIQRKQIEAFQVLRNNINDIKLPDEFGGVTSRAPRTVREVVSAIQDVKTKLFSRWDKLAREAGEKGADFNPIKTVGELQKYISDKSYSPSLRKYAREVLDEIAELKGENPLVIQSRIKELNESLAGYFAGRVEKGRARIDASVAKLLNEELDDIIFNFTGGDYKALRSQFSALKSLEKDAIRAAQRMLNRQNKGLIDFTDIFTGGDLMSGILTLNPTAVARGVFSRGIKELYKYLNNPDRYIRKIFQELGETVEPQRLINRGLPTPSGKVSGAIPLSTPLKSKPLPKGKGEILKSTPLVSKEVSNFIKKAYQEAPLAKKEIDTTANIIAKKYNGIVAEAPLKKQEKVLFNIKNKYNGDSSRVSDIARNTIIVSPEDAPKVFKELQKNPNYFSGKFVDPKTDPLGYSGYNTKYRASNGHIAEIQINTPEMIYAKEPAESAITQLGKELYNQLNKQYNGTGGKGHLYYDEWAKALGEGNYKLAQSIESKSRSYYSKF